METKNNIPTIKELELRDLKSNPLKYIDNLTVYKDSEKVKQVREGLIKDPKDINWDEISDYSKSYTQKHYIPVLNTIMFQMFIKPSLHKIYQYLPKEASNPSYLGMFTKDGVPHISIQFTVNH